MLKLFARSVEERRVGYSHNIGDGDTKTYLLLKNADLYADLAIEKKLKTQMQRTKVSDGKTIGGKGRLTDCLILKLTTFYGNAL